MVQFLFPSLICVLFSSALAIEIGDLPTFQHGVRGTLHIRNTRQIFIEDFSYDGLGPATFLYYYPPGQAIDRNGGGFIIPVPGGGADGRFRFGRRYQMEDLLVDLPSGVDVCDIGTLTLWCQPFRVFFTSIIIPPSTFIQGSGGCLLKGSTTAPPPRTAIPPLATAPPPLTTLDNCDVLDETTQVSWTLNRNKREVVIQLCGCEAEEKGSTHYLAFGLSGSSSLISMFRADPVVAWVDETGGHAVDYHLSGYSQCRGGRGACPDELDHRVCSDDVTFLSGRKENGVQCIRFKRSYSSNDTTCDLPLDPDNRNLHAVWAVGPLGATVFKHFKRSGYNDPPVHFGRSPVNNCPQAVRCRKSCDPFTAKRIVALQDETFVARIGPSGGERGYSGITGRPGWGILWFINGTLLPELVVQRGRTYTFIVEGGNDTNIQANYHPLYITDSISGGWSFQSAVQRQNETRFAGFDAQDNPTAVGRLCNFMESEVSRALLQNCSTLEEYTKSLQLTCNEGQAAVLKWTPDQNTPDLVYYQCTVHLNLGWKIHVMDAPTTTTPTEVSTKVPTTSTSKPTEVSTKVPTTSTTEVSTEVPTTSTSKPTEVSTEVPTEVPTTSTSKPTEVSTTISTTEAPTMLTTIEIGELPNFQHGIGGTLHIRNTRQILIKDFSYDGLGPGTFLYYYPPGQALDRNGGGFIIPVPGGGADGSFKSGRRYQMEDLLVDLPSGVDVCDIGTLTLWCRPFRVFFTSITISPSTFVQGSSECLLQGLTTAPPLTTMSSKPTEVSTKVPTTSTSKPTEVSTEVPTTSTSKPTEVSTKVPTTSTSKPTEVSTEVPTTSTSKPTEVSTTISTTEAPTMLTTIEIGELPNFQHGVGGTLHIRNTRQILIEDFSYDGLGPATFLYYYPPGQALDRNGGGFIIPVPGGGADGRFRFGRRYQIEDLLVDLPSGVDVCDIGTLTLWCRPFRAFFTSITIPPSTFVQGSSECLLQELTTAPPLTTMSSRTAIPPLATAQPPSTTLDNCDVLDETTQVSWTLNRNKREIVIQLCGCEAEEEGSTHYLAFGLSGSPSSISMFRADPVVAWVNETGGYAVDYHLSGYFQCRGGRGACPDELDLRGCSNDVTFLSGRRENGVQCIMFKRSYSSNDTTCDQPLDPDNRNFHAVWAVGPLGATAFKHFKRSNRNDPPVHFGRSPPVNNCAQAVRCRKSCDPFTPKKIVALQDETFVARIGPSGGERGYSGITGRPGWGILWFINGTLLPELVVERGMTYTFIVEGGDNPIDAANYHPFYITDSISGGRSLQSSKEQDSERVFAGYDEEGEDPTAAGRFCSYMETALSSSLRDNCSTLEEYTKSLQLTCNEGQAAVLKWTPDQNTPDLVYYQCAVHLNLGWKIHVMDAPVGPTTEATSKPTEISTGQPVTSVPTVASTDMPTTSTSKPTEVSPMTSLPTVKSTSIPTSKPTEVSTRQPTTTAISTMMPASTELPTKRSCPPMCTYTFCTNRNTRRDLCSNPSPSGSSNCSQCHLTYCHACYNSLETITSLPGNCGTRTMQEIATNQGRRFSQWVVCVRRAHPAEHRRVPSRQRSQANFACYNPVCV